MTSLATPLQIFCDFMLLSNVIFKSLNGPDNIGQVDLQAWMGK